MSLPRFGLTLLAPWWAFILWNGKNIENRGAGVAGAIGGYRGRVLLTASKGHTLQNDTRRPFRLASGEIHPEVGADINDICGDLADAGISGPWSDGAPTVNLRLLRDRAGHAVGTARIAGIYKPKAHPKNSWHASGQFGILLRDIEAIEPRLATGGQGFWRVTECFECGRILAQGARHTCEALLADPPDQQLAMFGADTQGAPS